MRSSTRHVDAGEVRVAHVAHARRAVDDLDERLVRVARAVALGDVAGSVDARVAGDQLALVERQQVRREDERLAEAELLLDLGRVAVRADL